MDEYVRTFVDSTDHNNNKKNRLTNTIQQDVVKQIASELEQGVISERSKAILGEQGIEEFNKQLQNRKEKNVFMEQSKIENAEIMKAIEKNPELNITTAKNEIEQKGYNQAINEIANKIQTEITAARKVEGTTINSGENQKPITTVASADNDEKVVYTISGENTQEPIREVSTNQNTKVHNFPEEGIREQIISRLTNNNGKVNSHSRGNTQPSIDALNIKIDKTKKVVNVGNALKQRAGTDNTAYKGKKSGKTSNKGTRNSKSSSRRKKGA